MRSASVTSEVSLVNARISLWNSETDKQTFLCCFASQVATETLHQRFHSLSQKKWDPTQHKNVYLSVSEFHNEILALTNETSDMTDAECMTQIPGLDLIFYQGLIQRLKDNDAASQGDDDSPNIIVI